MFSSQIRSLFFKACLTRNIPSRICKLYFPTLYLKSAVSPYVKQTQRQCTSSAISQEIQELANDIIGDESDHKVNKKREVVKVLDFLVSRGCSADEIKEKYLNYLDVSHCSYVKAKLLADIDADIGRLIPLMSMSIASVRLAKKRAREDKLYLANFTNRIEYLSHNLELPTEELLRLLSKHSSLLTMPFSRLETKMEVLKSARISSKYIVKDLWIFNYNESLLRSRISAAKQAGFTLKPWLLRCPEEFFFTMLKRWQHRQNILDGKDDMKYLAERLDCSDKYIEYMAERNKAMRTINIPKIEQIITFLYSKGYTPQEVRLFPRVFCSSVETLSKRYDEFLRIKSTTPTIPQLCFSVKKYKSALGMK